jgi:hypothetical protein
LIGTGVGWAAGVGVAETTAAAVTVTGVAETANVACGGDMCASEVQDAGTIANNIVQTLGADGDPTNEVVQVTDAFQKTIDAAKVNGQQITVLGRFKEGLQGFANQVGGRFLSMPDEEYTWDKNVQYIKDALARGDLIVTRPDITQVDPTSYYAREILLLKDLDYHFVDGVLKPIVEK